MPQLMIDTTTESPAMLRLTAQMLFDIAGMREKELAGPQVSGPAAPPAIVIESPRTDLDPAKLFGSPGAASGVTRVAGRELEPGETVADAMAKLKATIGGTPGSYGAPLAPPPLAPPPLAPLAPNAIPPAPGNAAPDKFDTSGMPFDVRIHQVKRGKKLDGTWKHRKGLDDAVKLAVEAELQPRRRAVGAPPPPPAAPVQQQLPAPPPPNAGSLPPPPPPPVAPPAAQAPQTVQGAQAPAQAPQGQAAPQALVFRDVMLAITTAMAAKKLTLEQMDQFLIPRGLPSKAIVAIGDRPDIWADCIAYVKSLTG